MASRISRRAFAAAAATGAFGTGLGLGSKGQAQAPTSLAVRIERDLVSLDPAFRAGPEDGNVSRVVHQRLVAQKPNSVELELDAAAEVKQVSPTLVEFTLKPGQMFTDGYGEMTAEDVKFSFERFAVAPVDGQESPYKSDWAGLTGVQVTGPRSGRIVLSKPNAGLFAIALADVSGCIVSKRAVAERGPALNTRPVGSGPYQIASIVKQRGAVLHRNPGYAGGRPYFDEIRLNFIQDPKTAELALRSGELDFAVLPPAVAEPLRRVQSLAVEQKPGLAYLWLGINMQKPPFDDVRVRQAIRAGLDVDQMLLAGFNGKAPRLNALIMQPILGTWPDAPVYRRNVAEAKRLLAEAGKPQIRARITLLNQPAFQAMALVARAQLAEVGIQLDLDVQEGATFWEAGKGETGKNLDLFLMRFNGKLDPSFLMQWFTSDQIGSWNWQRFASPDYDRLAAEAVAELDPAKRAALVIKAQQEMDKSAAFVWLTNDVAFTVHRSQIRPAFLPGAIDWQLDRFTAA